MVVVGFEERDYQVYELARSRPFKWCMARDKGEAEFASGLGYSDSERSAGVEHIDLLELLIDQPIFVGFKADSSLRRLLESLSSPDKKYISTEDSTFLRICRVGENVYVGKLVHESLTTYRIDDVRRNVLSIMRKLVGETRLPSHLEILACKEVEADHLLTRNTHA